MKKNSTLSWRKMNPFGGRCFMMLVLVFAFHLSNAQIQLVKDVNQWADPYLNDFNALEAHGNNAFFHAKGGLYFTDGTPEGTVLVKNFDWLEGAQSYNGYFYFTPGQGLWRSDGTAAGTVLFKNINPLADYVNTAPNFIEVNGILYFLANDPTYGTEVWRTDGTQAGTYILKDIKPGSASSFPANLTAVGNKLFFSAPSGNNKGIELWVSDGTAAGTKMVYDINPGSNSSDPGNLINVNGVCFFTAKDVTHGKELWRSDGTVAGTWLVKDIRPGSGGTISKLLPVNGLAFFEAHDGVHGKEIWKSDGTEAGTVMVKDIYPGSGGSSGIYVTNDVFSYNGIYYFVAIYGGNKLWRTDGTEAGTYPITSPLQHADFSFMQVNYTVFNNQVYFFAQDDWRFTQLWKTDGTIGNTVLVDPHLAYFNYGTYAQLEACGSRLFMIAQEFNNETGGFSATKIRIGDGTPEGTTDVFSLTTATLGSNPTSFVPINGATLYSSREGDYLYNNLYRTDGTTSGTTQVKKLREIHNITALDDHRVIFSGYVDYEQGSDLWVSDGTPAGTSNITPPGVNIVIRSIAKLGSGLLFSADDNYMNNDNTLYKTDGTAAGTTVVKSFADYNFYTPGGLTTYGNKVLFSAAPDASTSSRELWISDGTPAGTMLLADLNPAGGSDPRGFTPVGSKMVFAAYDGAGNELFITDGTTAGSVLLKDFSSGNNSIQELTPLPNKAVFTVWNPSTSRSLWVTDGTSVGTQLLKDFVAGDEQIDIVDRVGNDLIVLVTIGGVSGVTELWKTDGTAAGTIKVKELSETFLHVYASEVVDGILYFGRPAEGGGLWRTDGTECGTFEIESALPISVEDVGAVGSTVIFNGNINEQPYTSQFGPELYRYDVETVPPCISVAGRSAQDATNSFVEETETVKSYPNPFRGEIAIEVKGSETERFGLEVFTINGRSIQSIGNLSFNTIHRFGGQWQEGIYLLKVKLDGKVITKKVVKLY